MELSASGQVEGVGFDGDDVVRGELFGSAGEHLVGEVYGQDGGEDGGGKVGESAGFVSHP